MGLSPGTACLSPPKLVKSLAGNRLRRCPSPSHPPSHGPALLLCHLTQGSSSQLRCNNSSWTFVDQFKAQLFFFSPLSKQSWCLLPQIEATPWPGWGAQLTETTSELRFVTASHNLWGCSPAAERQLNFGFVFPEDAFWGKTLNIPGRAH